MLTALALGTQIQIEASNLEIASNNELFLATASPDTVLSSRQFASGKISRRVKAAQKRILTRSTTVSSRVDTNIASQLEAIRALPRDSSARIAQFTYVRKDEPIVQYKYHKKHPLFLSEPSVVRYQVSLDSAKWVYRLRYMMNESDLRIPVEIPLEEYSTLQLKQSVRRNWESMAQYYEQIYDSKTSLGDLMGSITKIEVPIPKNPIFSIFGPNIIKLNVNGAIDIHAGFRNTEYDLASSSPMGQSQGTPDFKQQIQVTVDGEIGDKLKIAADWNTQRTFEYENQLHVKYTGYQDEIVQSVEAGNVSLPTNSSFISGGSALFGIMAKFQVGPLRLTTVATQKKGQIKEISVSGGGEAKAIEIRPTDYSTNHFFIDKSYIDKNLYERYYLNNYTEDSMKILDIEVWITSTASTNPLGSRYVVAFMNQDTVELLQKDPSARRKYFAQDPGKVEQGVFIKLEPNEYEYNSSTGVISLKTAIQDNQAVAVYYKISHSDMSAKYIGNSGQEQYNPLDSLKLIMKLVRPTNFQSDYKDAWRLQLKNRYSLNMFGIEEKGFEFYIEYQLPGQTAVREVENIGLLELFGLDRYSGTGAQAQPDKAFDYYNGVTIDEANGEIIFPTIEPFSKKSLQKFLNLHFPNPQDQDTILANSLSFDAIYDTSASAARNNPRNLYYLRGSAKGSGSSSFSIGFNTVEGSVEVTSAGQRLVPGVDYTVDYISSKVFIKNQMYLAPGRDIQIKYEANDMFQLASKSLLGARGEFDLSKNSTIGFTIMNYSQQSLSDKVRVGEEPISNMMLGIDGRTMIDAPWLTDAMNFVPGIKTTVSSKISLSGEAAYMLPNPNTRTSPVKSDGGKGVAYIDDFEGARQTIPLGGSYLAWKAASAPWYSPYLDTLYTVVGRYIPFSDQLVNNGIVSEKEKMFYKAHACWFNVLPSDLIIESIWGDKKDAVPGEDQVLSLDLYFRPAVRGAFNYSMNLEQTIGLNESNTHKRAWGGMQRVLGTTSTNLIEQNVAFIELWINILEHQDSDAKLNIDLGYISEDVIPNKEPDTEDGLGVAGSYKTGTLLPNYDWGIDMRSDAIERDSSAGFIAKYPEHPEYYNDPSGDNSGQLPVGGKITEWTDADRFVNVNGTEGNHLTSDEGRMFPDGEDLNGNSTMDPLNAYFEYEIPLDINSIEFQKIVAGKGENNWHQIRIPLSEFTRKIGEPTFTSVQGVRLWVTGASQPVLLRIVEFNLVGNQWEKRDRADSSFEISVVNYEDNPNYDPGEIGVDRQRDLTRKDKQVLGNEQSLNLIVKNLHDGDKKEVVRNFSIKPLDMFNYRTLKLFVHGQADFDDVKGYRPFKYDSTNINNYDARFFIRFGDDTNNYYEYSAPLQPGWNGNDVNIKFGELTALKALSIALADSGKSVTDGPPDSKYRMLGNPRLDNIKFISIGIQNPEDKGYPTDVLTGELWVNELRLTDVDDTPGWAYKYGAKISFADIGSLAFSYTELSPFFHQLEVPFGSRITSRSWNITSAFSFGKLLPDSWAGSVIDASYSHSETMNKPRYLPGTDILVEKAAEAVASNTSQDTTKYDNADDVRLKSEDLIVTNSYSIPTIKLNIPLKTWLVTETINKMTFGFNYSITQMRNPSIRYSQAWNWGASFQYATQFNKNNYVLPTSLFGDHSILRPWKNFKFFFTPQQISFSASLSQNRSESHTRKETEPSLPAHSMSATRSMNFNWQFFEAGLLDFGVNYTVSISSSLDHLEQRKGSNQFRSFSDILGDMFFSDRLINFGIDQSYDQSMTFNTKLASPKVFMLDKIFTPNFRYSVGYKWTNNIPLGPLGKSAGWTASPTFSLDINIKPITDAIWSPASASKPIPAPADTSAGKRLENPENKFDITRMLIKNTLFDFDKINISFTQTNSSQNNGVRGSNGFANLFGRVPFFQSSLVENGPSLLYQLGLISDPNGRLVLKTKGTFPFISGHTDPGIRASDTVDVSLADNFSQNNNLSFQTSRPLWEGASIDLNWKVSWVYNDNRTSKVNNDNRTIKDSIGIPYGMTNTVSGNISRSYISLPSFFIFKLFNTNLENVNKKYKELKQADEENSSAANVAKLSQAFEEGLEVFPWLSKILGPIAPRVNWSFRWGGLESINFLKSFASSISLDHLYSSTYTQGYKMVRGGSKEITTQSVTYGFTPLIGLNIAFKDIAKGKLSTTLRYNSTTTYDLTPASFAVGENSKSDIAVSVSFSRQGFEIPLFGLSLMNNIDIRINYSYSRTSTLRFDFNDFKSDGIPLDVVGITKIEPRIGYTLSERVTASLYYLYTKLTPEGGAKTLGYTTNEGGVDVNIAIK